MGLEWWYDITTCVLYLVWTEAAEENYGVRMKVVTVKQFSNFAFKSPDPIVDGTDLHWSGLIIAALFCSVCYQIDIKYITEDKSRRKLQISDSRQRNFSFVLK